VIVSSERFTFRAAAGSDVEAMSGVLERAGLSSFRPEILRFSLASSSTQMFVGCRDGQIVSVAGGVSFGSTGWLGNVGVDYELRGQGLGLAISEMTVDWLHQARVETVLLTATDLGRPIYERLGFVDEGIPYGIWEQRRRPDPGGRDAVAAERGQIGAAIRHDAAATGEDRRSYLTPFADRVFVPAGPALEGYRVELPWGGGPVIAADAEAARPLIAGMIHASPGSRLAFPEVNAQGAALATSLGFDLAGRVRRMRLGPPVPAFRPEGIYNVFSLAAGLWRGRARRWHDRSSPSMRRL
jgi:predicted N-acetyltransferase YhbS